jgi:glutathione synthase/RimK-type ligase-like ATP-grasp enzyme
MLFLNSENDVSGRKIINYLCREIDLVVLDHLSVENIKLIPFEDFRIIFLKSQIKIKDCINSMESGEILHFLNYLLKRHSVSLYGQNIISEPSKPEVLEMAKRIGLSIPEYIVINSKAKLAGFMERKGRVICKSLESQNLFFFSDKPLELYNCFSSEINSSDLKDIPNNFFPSFFQEFIMKDLELKIFFFEGVFFSAALIPEDNKFEVDIKASPYRCVPYSINDDLKTKLIKLMSHFNLKMGTIDVLIKGDTTYFLEINPSGQFGNLSLECGYNIEEFIASELLKKYKKYDRI